MAYVRLLVRLVELLVHVVETCITAKPACETSDIRMLEELIFNQYSESFYSTVHNNVFFL